MLYNSPMNPRKETFKAARERLLQEAHQKGWQTQLTAGNGSMKPLKAPRILVPGVEDRWIELRPQGCGAVGGLSSWLDYRGLSLAEFGRRV